MSGIILAHLRESPKDQPFKHFEEKNLWKTRERAQKFTGCSEFYIFI